MHHEARGLRHTQSSLQNQSIFSLQNQLGTDSLIRALKRREERRSEKQKHDDVATSVTTFDTQQA